jgi:hypothetical protein
MNCTLTLFTGVLKTLQKYSHVSTVHGSFGWSSSHIYRLVDGHVGDLMPLGTVWVSVPLLLWPSYVHMQMFSRSVWMKNQTIIAIIHSLDTIQNRGQTYSQRAGYEPTIPVLERRKTVFGSESVFYITTAATHFLVQNGGLKKQTVSSGSFPVGAPMSSCCTDYVRTVMERGGYILLDRICHKTLYTRSSLTTLELFSSSPFNLEVDDPQHIRLFWWKLEEHETGRGGGITSESVFTPVQNSESVFIPPQNSETPLYFYL